MRLIILPVKYTLMNGCDYLFCHKNIDLCHFLICSAFSPIFYFFVFFEFGENCILFVILKNILVLFHLIVNALKNDT